MSIYFSLLWARLIFEVCTTTSLWFKTRLEKQQSTLYLSSSFPACRITIMAYHNGQLLWSHYYVLGTVVSSSFSSEFSIYTGFPLDAITVPLRNETEAGE